MIGPKIEGFRTGQHVKIIGGTKIFNGKTGYIVRIDSEQDVYFFTVQFMYRRKIQNILCRSTDIEAVQE